MLHYTGCPYWNYFPGPPCPSNILQLRQELRLHLPIVHSSSDTYHTGDSGKVISEPVDSYLVLLNELYPNICEVCWCFEKQMDYNDLFVQTTEQIGGSLARSLTFIYLCIMILNIFFYFLCVRFGFFILYKIYYTIIIFNIYYIQNTNIMKCQ